MAFENDSRSRPDSIAPAAALEMLRSVPADSPLFRRACEILEGKLEIEAGFPKALDRLGKKFLTIGMSTANDYDGFYFTVQAIRMFHPEILDDTEFLVIDNGSSLECAKAMYRLACWVPNLRYLPCRIHQGTAVRDAIFREASGDFVLVTDSHVFFEAGSLAKLIAYCRSNPDSHDLLQGPLLSDAITGKVIGTQFEHTWSRGMYGDWGTDERGTAADHPAFEIRMQGLGAFCCRKAAWPGFNPRLFGFGGEEGYIHEKIRRAGGRNLCLPFLRWLHRFERPDGPKYPMNWEDRIRNYLLIYDELGMAAEDMIRHYSELIGQERTDAAVRAVQVELSSPFHAIDAVFCIHHEEQSDRREGMRRRFAEFGIEQKVRWYKAAETPLDRHIGAVLSHRRILAEAKMRALKTVIVFEDNNEFPPDALAVMQEALTDLQKSEWQVSFLDGPAIAYHHTFFEAILQAIPDDAVIVARIVRDLGAGAGSSMRQLLRLLGIHAAGEELTVLQQANAQRVREVYASLSATPD